MRRDDIDETLRQLEESLWRAETRFDRSHMEQILAEDFCEFGRSGRTYGRAEVLPAPGETGEIDATLPLPGFQVRVLSAEIAQVIYVSGVRHGDTVETGNRSSIWRREAAGWRLCFHQGTPTG